MCLCVFPIRENVREEKGKCKLREIMYTAIHYIRDEIQEKDENRLILDYLFPIRGITCGI